MKREVSIKRSFVYYQKGLIKERCQIKERVYMKKGKGGKKNKKKTKTYPKKRGNVITNSIPKQYKNKTNTKMIKTNPIPKHIITK